jgi:phosphoglycerate-specific signal transduction histidine kinase
MVKHRNRKPTKENSEPQAAAWYLRTELRRYLRARLLLHRMKKKNSDKSNDHRQSKVQLRECKKKQISSLA